MITKWLLSDLTHQADDLYEQTRLAQLHCKGHRRQTMGKIRHIAGRTDVLWMSFGAGFLKGYISDSKQSEFARWLPVAVRLMM